LSDSSQQDRRVYGIDIGEVRHEPVARPWKLRLYVTALLLAPVVMLAGTVLWMMLPAYRLHAQYAYLADTGYGMRLRGADCDVVVYGDSTAMTGVEPHVIEQRTGLKTCNIAEVAGVQVVDGMMVLDTYLRHNRPPQFIVFQYAPENLNPAKNWNEVSTFEGVFLRLQYRPDAAFWREMLRHPDELIGDAELGFRTGVEWLFKPRLPAAVLDARDTSHGRLPERGPAFTSCPGIVSLRAPDLAWLAGLRSRYGVHGTRVLIDVTPLPPCDVSRSFYAPRATPGVVDNVLGTLPMTQYTDTGRLHMTDAGAAVMSSQIADQILAIQQKTTSTNAKNTTDERSAP
jgi:hypothetical protein